MATHPDARPPSHRTRPRGPLSRALDRAAQRRFFERLIKHTNNFDKVAWLGVPVWQNVFDLWNIQDAIAETKPDVLIETGTNRGGSSFFYAQLFDLLYPGDTQRGRIFTIDIEKLHERAHPRVTCHIGSSTAPETLDAARRWLAGAPRVMVILDSDHSRNHVRQELELYAPLVTKGCYMLCQDGIIDDLPMFHRHGEQGPRLAIEDFFRDSPAARDFEIDHQRCEKFLISHHPLGWLRRIR